MRLLAFMAVAVLLTSGNVLAQATTSPAVSAGPGTGPTTEPSTGLDLPKGGDEKAWSFSLSASTYIVPDDREYVQPTVTADHDWLHLEARYNYEALDTGSAWVGYNFSGGDKLAWEFTPMLGGVFGKTVGVAPGYKGSLSWWKIELYSEGEFVFDADNFEDSFFYNWSELSLSPVEWFRFGLVTQRTRVYESDRDIQRGVLVGCSWKNIDVTAYVLDPDTDKPTFVFAVGLNF